MPQQNVEYRDPWKDLARRKGTRQVELDKVLSVLSVESRKAQELKKALLDRVSELSRRP